MKASTPTQTPTPSLKEGEVAVQIDEDIETAIDVSFIEHNNDLLKVCNVYQSDPDNKEKSDFDWWSKYYYSVEDERRTQKDYVDQGHDKMVVYQKELEEVFNRLLQYPLIILFKMLLFS